MQKEQQPTIENLYDIINDFSDELDAAHATIDFWEKKYHQDLNAALVQHRKKMDAMMSKWNEEKSEHLYYYQKYQELKERHLEKFKGVVMENKTPFINEAYHKERMSDMVGSRNHMLMVIRSLRKQKAEISNQFKQLKLDYQKLKSKKEACVPYKYITMI